jgi:hypothetical protein
MNGALSSGSSNESGQLNIHIAIISPPQRNPIDAALSQAVANLQSQSASLARQQQRLEALRTQQLELQRQQLQLQRAQELRSTISLDSAINEIDIDLEEEVPQVHSRSYNGFAQSSSSSSSSSSAQLVRRTPVVANENGSTDLISQRVAAAAAAFDDIDELLSVLGLPTTETYGANGLFASSGEDRSTPPSLSAASEGTRGGENSDNGRAKFRSSSNENDTATSSRPYQSLRSAVPGALSTSLSSSTASATATDGLDEQPPRRRSILERIQS